MSPTGLSDEMISMMISMGPEQRAATLNGFLSGLDRVLGIQFISVSEDAVHATCEVTGNHLQVFGIVHGGVYASLAETCCSTGAAISVLSRDKNVVGRSNTTHFLKAARDKETLYIHAWFHEEVSNKELVWKCRISKDSEVDFAQSTVVLNVLERNHKVGGAVLDFIATAD